MTDNLFLSEIARVLAECIDNKKDCEEISIALVEAAKIKQNSSRHVRAPFGQPKPDDTTVVVAIVDIS